MGHGRIGTDIWAMEEERQRYGPWKNRDRYGAWENMDRYGPWKDSGRDMGHVRRGKEHIWGMEE